ncbi:hypothetical protein LMG26685_04465 [Achromobacter mucicolens]|jgi:hypothetical protein|uniref:hypothetical protein n=1 Tax=Achromobacter mucicolens TaxID=1389922 RepID=UPI001467DDBB|nr:hypothetical protein [Achromobacter mucicolens]MDG9966695.1 hypothetical protein [Achromobacter mucicolens]CAB3684663.1 hypothetical protein LMG26685_04465 [Achromobacter mucicolens]
MPARTPDPGIPTLTHRAEPSFHDPADDDADAPLLTELADEAGPVYEHDPFPVLTDVADDDGPPEPAAAPALRALPDATVLAARLQAEVEQVMRQALADAVTQLQARMDAELPAIVSRVLNEVRQG